MGVRREEVTGREYHPSLAGGGQARFLATLRCVYAGVAGPGNVLVD